MSSKTPSISTRGPTPKADFRNAIALAAFEGALFGVAGGASI
jgi:hypothetical protein